jgi:inner membrane transporter RhtA
MPVAGLVATAAVGASVLPRITPDLILVGLGLALLLPVAPFILELLALRRLNTAAFGTLMSLEPALALLIGFLILHQVPGPAAIVGIAFVILAGMGAARSGTRDTSAPVQLG